MRRCGKFNAVGHDKRVMEEVGNIMWEEEMEDDTMVKQVSNVMHGEWGAGGVECS